MKYKFGPRNFPRLFLFHSKQYRDNIGEKNGKNKKTVFFCQNCGYESPKWLGQCPGCKEWNTFVEETVDKKSISSSGKVKKESKAAQVLPLSAVKSDERGAYSDRYSRV